MPRPTPDIPNASMADIAFLMLVFFLVTTTIANDRGLSLQLPPPPDPKQDIAEIKDRNVLNIQVNSQDLVLVEKDRWTGSMNDLTDKIKEFITNNGKDPELSDSPDEATVSYKTDRGTTYKKYIEILDAIEAAYYEIYAENAGLTTADWRDKASNLSDPANLEIYNKSREGYPMRLSIAEPTKVGG